MDRMRVEPGTTMTSNALALRELGDITRTGRRLSSRAQ